jgi:hypothetical protein
MKKISVVVIAIFIVLIAGFVAFNSKNKTNQKSSNSSSNQPAFKEGGKEQRQFNFPGLSGEVASIAGNQVTIKIIETPKFPRNMNQREGRNAGTRNNGGQWNRGEGWQSGNSQGRQRTIKYTGERKNVIIPVGVPITTMVRTETGRETQTVAFNKIKKGDILQIWYSDKEQAIISRIGIRSQTPARS